ncbi:transcriptional regulator [Candidatus Bathyarchaeota archaeon]|nr:transcriptional regulator [Candidatus Bathyarchaeota archaeon]
MSKDQAIGFLILLTCLAVATLYCVGLFWPALEAFRFWIIATPVFIGFMAVMAIGAWIGWTMATTPPPKPIEEIEQEEQKTKEETTH